MPKSMTGYGKGVATTEKYNIVFEMKSVNHRYLEVSSRAPRSCLFLEDAVKKEIGKKLNRGKVDSFITLEFLGDNGTEVVLNEEYAKSYFRALKQLNHVCGLNEDITLNMVARNSSVFDAKSTELDEEELMAATLSAVNEALDNMLKMRITEGEAMKEDIESRLNAILEKVAFIEERSPQTVKEYNDKLKLRVQELIGDASLDEERIINEVAVMADKLAVAEETVRLRSHIAQMKDLLGSDVPIGRKMDFVVQEMNREANTIGSKAQDTDITGAVIFIKGEIEKVREQVQNIE